MFIFFFCPVLGCLLLICCVVILAAWLIFLFVCFYWSWCRSPSINLTSLSQSKGWFLLILLCRQEKIIEQVCWIYIKIIPTWSIRGEMCPIFNFCGKHFWPIRKLIWVETDVRMILSCITSSGDHGLWKLSAVFVHWCYQPVTIENYLLPTHLDHYALRI